MVRPEMKLAPGWLTLDTRFNYMQLVLLAVVLLSVLLAVLIGERGVRGVPA